MLIFRMCSVLTRISTSAWSAWRKVHLQAPLLLVLLVVPAMTQIQPQSMSLSPLATLSTLLQGLVRMPPAEVIVPLVAPRI